MARILQLRKSCLRAAAASILALARVAESAAHGAAPARPGATVPVGAGSVPVWASVDVLVVGGSTAAVAAAQAAENAGASVFLAAPYPYLGEDMTGTLRLWLDKDERPDTPLARAVFAGAGPSLPGFQNRVPFTYRASLASVPPHKDTDPPTRLADLHWGSARRESVQYNGDPVLELDLGKPRAFRRVYLLAYHARDFQIADCRVQTSITGKDWTAPVRVGNSAPEQRSVDEGALALSCVFPKTATARYLRITVHRSSGSSRVLLGELVVIGVRPGSRPAPPAPMPSPAHVKKVLTSALLRAGVRFLLGVLPCAVVCAPPPGPGAPGPIRGVVFVTRSGRMAVLARVVIDATREARIARLAHCRFRPAPFAAPAVIRRVVVGAAPRPGPDLAVIRLAPPFPGRTRKTRHGLRTAYSAFVCRWTPPEPLPAPVSPAALAEFRRRLLDRTDVPERETGADLCLRLPRAAVQCTVSLARELRDPAGIPPGAWTPRGRPRLQLLNPCMDIPRKSAELLFRPAASIRLGTLLGARAAALARDLPPAAGNLRVFVPRPARNAPARAAAQPAREVRAPSAALPGRRSSIPRVPWPPHAMPVLGRYDVVVVGGGTSGAPAGIAAARQGARTLVVERQYALGGVGTRGAITKYYWGARIGFSREVQDGQADWRAAQREDWWRRTLHAAGAEVWFGAAGYGAVLERRRVCGVLVAGPWGAGVVLAKTVVDATGSADIAAAAGAPCLRPGETSLAVQGTGLPPLTLGADYINTDFTIADETDPLDSTRIQVQATLMGRGVFDIGTLVDSRERRRILGDYRLDPIDEVLQRRFPDAVATAWSNFDSHGFTIHPLFFLADPGRSGIRTWIPYRCLLPRGLDGILVIGLGLSAHRDALPPIRMQADVQNLGYAAGVAAAMAAGIGGHTRRIQLAALQRRLRRLGILPELPKRAKTAPPPDSPRELAAAVRRGVRTLEDTARILASPGAARPLLRSALARARTPRRRLRFAVLLAFLDDPTGAEIIRSALEAVPGLDSGWRYRSGGQYGRSLSSMDQWILALGWCRARNALPAILRKADRLTPESAFSHFRAVAMALDRLRDPRAVPILAKILARPGIRGHAMTRWSQVRAAAVAVPSFTGLRRRRDALRELYLAAALFHCGDSHNLGRTILEHYRRDYRAVFARYAARLLAAPDSRGAASTGPAPPER